MPPARCGTSRCRSANRSTRRPPSSARRCVRALGESLGSYPVALGLPQLRAKRSRAGSNAGSTLPPGTIRADDMVLPVNGTREALFSFVQAVIDRAAVAARARPLVLMPNPFYQIYEGAALLAGAEPRFLNCTEATRLPARPRRRRCRHVGPLPGPLPVHAGQSHRRGHAGAYLRRALELSARHGFMIASDECYSELYFDESAPPPGLLQAAFRAGNDDLRALRRVSQPVEALERAGPALGLRRRRRRRFWRGTASTARTMAARCRCTPSSPACRRGTTSCTSLTTGGCIARSSRGSRRSSRPALQQEPRDSRQAASISGRGWRDDEAFARGLFEQQHVTVLPGTLSRARHGSRQPGPWSCPHLARGQRRRLRRGRTPHRRVRVHQQMLTTRRASCSRRRLRQRPLRNCENCETMTRAIRRVAASA